MDPSNLGYLPFENQKISHATAADQHHQELASANRYTLLIGEFE